MVKGCILLLTGILTLVGMSASAQSEQALTDLTGGVIPIIIEQHTSLQPGGKLSTSRGGLTTRSDLRYVVRVKNQTNDPIVGSSLIVIVDSITEVARGRVVTNLVEVVGYDGFTEKGKPFFRIPEGDTPELPPYADSEAIVVRIVNPDLLRLSPPTLRVWGIRITPAMTIERLRDTLLRKGLLSPEEATSIFDSPDKSHH